jgi:Zn-dependent protease
MGTFQVRDPDVAIYFLVSFIVATSIHEFMHAWTAWRLGDDTAQRLGRITLNPIAHFDPFGFLGMVLISFGIPAIGWGRPVPVNPNRLRGSLRGRSSGMAVVALAGPVSNVVQAAAVAIPLRLTHANLGEMGRAGSFLAAYLVVNLLLAAFNMIPIPPLDGSKILLGLLPNFWYPILAPLERNGFVILILLSFVGRSVGGGSIIGSMYDPVYRLLAGVLTNDFRF